MTLHFALVDGRPAFFDSRLHGDAIPVGAVKVSPARHADLLEAQAAGKEIYADVAGRPRFREPHVDAAQQRDNLSQLVRNEAARRIRSVSPTWRQMNDIRAPSAAGRARFDLIDQIRAASTRIEADIAAASAGELSSLDVQNSPHWPQD